MSLTLRLAEPADLPRLAQLAAQLVHIHHDFDAERFFLPRGVEEGYRRWFGRELENEDAILIAAVKDDAIVGYAYGRIEERDFNMLLDRHAALHDILVDESARGLGAGEALVERFCAIVKERGVPRVVLHTAASNDRAARLFERLGFRPTMIERMRVL